MYRRGALHLRGGPAQIAWSDRLEADHDNLRAALDRALQRDDVGLGAQLASELADFWIIRGYAGEGR